MNNKEMYTNVKSISPWQMMKVFIFSIVSAASRLAGATEIFANTTANVLTIADELAESGVIMARDNKEITQIKSTGSTARAKEDLYEEFPELRPETPSTETTTEATT